MPKEVWYPPLRCTNTELKHTKLSVTGFLYSRLHLEYPHEIDFLISGTLGTYFPMTGLIAVVIIL